MSWVVVYKNSEIDWDLRVNEIKNTDSYIAEESDE